MIWEKGIDLQVLHQANGQAKGDRSRIVIERERINQAMTFCTGSGSSTKRKRNTGQEKCERLEGIRDEEA